MNIADLRESSDSSDEDYIPDSSNANLPSEEDSDGNVEYPIPESEESSRNKKRRKVTSRKNKSPSPTKSINEQSADDLWADFKKDTGFKTRAERQLNTETAAYSNRKSTPISIEDNPGTHLKGAAAEPPKTIKVTEVFKFAGEEVKVEKEVTAASVSKMPDKRGAKSGMNSILSSIGKKTKISTLEKSKLDWDKFKKEEKIEDELQAYGKSKDGYLEKQDFLQRADVRCFEIEKDLRSTLRSNRLNNV